MTARHLEFLIEEPSMETFLRNLLPRILPTECTFQLHSFPYKRNLQRLRDRLRGYARWLPSDWRVVLLVDRDQDDCLVLKQQFAAGGAAAQAVSVYRGIDGELPASVYYLARTTGA